MKKINVLNFAVLTVIALLPVSCSNSLPSVPLSSSVQNQPVKDYTLKGKAEFPEFSTKAAFSDVISAATISIKGYGNVTEATGLTDEEGYFTLNPRMEFRPYDGDIYILEASKRIGGVEESLMTQRTFIKWNGLDWESITSPGIYINTKTTAMAIITDLKENYRDEVIGMIDTSGDVSIPLTHEYSDYTEEEVLKVAEMVKAVLLENKDPAYHIRYNSSSDEYYFDINDNIGKLIQTGECQGCNLTGARLAYSNLIRANLAGALLSKSDMSEANLSGVNLANSDLRESSFYNADLSVTFGEEGEEIPANLSGSNLSGANLGSVSLEGALLRGTDLSNSNLTEAVLYGADLTGANLEGAVLEGADFSGALWTDGIKVCAEDSIGQCD